MMDVLARLQWRCRRGTIELDLLLQRYLESCYSSADAGEKQTFMQLLELQDSDLLVYFFAARRPASQQLAALVDKIRNLAAA